MFPSKDKCPWIKLASFGTKRSAAGSLRTNKNLTAIYGIEADYDGEKVTMESAVCTLETYGIRAMLYPSPSNTASKPRWRVLCPLSKQHPPNARAALVARVNGALGGILAGESFTLSQGYFFGATPTSDYQVRLTFDDAAKGACIDELDDLDDIAIGKRGVKENPKAKPKSEQGARVEQGARDERHAAMLKAVLSGDTYHENLRDLAASYVATGMQTGAAINALYALMDNSQGPHDDRWRARRGQIPDLVTSAAAKFCPLNDEEDFEKRVNAESKKTELHYKLLTTAELNDLPPLRWRIRDVLPETGLGMILGMSTAGKTFIALDLAAHVSLGKDWHGFKTYAAPVVYVGLEGEQGIQPRIKAWAQHYKVPLPDTLRFVLQPFNMLSSENIPELTAAVLGAGGRGGIIIVDTLNRATPGADENSSVDMGDTIAAAKRLQAAIDGMVILVHHKGKTDAAGARGHSSLYGALDACISVNNTGVQRSWSTDYTKGGKSKDGQAVTRSFDLESVSLGVDDDMLPIGSAVVVPCALPAREHKPLTPAQKRAMDTYLSAAPVSGTLDEAGEFAGLHVEHWRAEFHKFSTGDSLDTKNKAFLRARNDLVDLGHMSVTNDLYRLTGAVAFREAEFSDVLRPDGGCHDLV
jgi:hypothetical protein